ncbi:MAG: bifunctional ornithine acetyltransferase/N-acetylglutamate synthase [Pelagibacteraceae bacterium]|nr:bifunctional ornithine acetyltransferase/N-acetylglutamate synthase [Pelagibacteraceae bacterium]|tara:strand:- start:10427 stop:11692 length:1266 start_codon:yes stop_codon:yes gene_type:complete
MKQKTSTKDLALSSNERLFEESKSIFKPKKSKNISPINPKFYTFHSGLKNRNKDLLIVLFEKSVNVASVYSKTSTPSAPIIWNRKNNNGKCKVLIVNSGNANAHTGKEGLKIIDKYAFEISKQFFCNKNEILVSSTGVIGEIFDPKLIIDCIKKIKKTNNTDLVCAVKAITTTDTYLKTSIVKVKINNKNFRIYGMAKGSGMIQPNMGTMLAYIFIECNLNKKNLNQLIKKNLEDTFNSISVDSDTSTSDTLMLFSSSKIKINIRDKKNFNKISEGIFKVMKDLSLQVIKDGEGLSKLININIIGAKNKYQAKKIAFSIVNSPLVKTSISGEDANWGRVIMAIGKTNEKIKQEKIKIYYGKYLVCSDGGPYRKCKIQKLNKYMKNKNIKITVDLGIGECSRSVIGNDLNYEYIRINADYRS